MTKILFSGCSFTYGAGLPGGPKNPELWANQLANEFTNPEITNIAETGKNNQWIFTETLNELVKNQYDVVVVGWTDTNRLNFNIGLETYNTSTMFAWDKPINLVANTTVNDRWLQETGNRQIGRAHV